jgi:hypothetical protein
MSEVPDVLYFVKDELGLRSMKQFEAKDQGGLDYYEYILKETADKAK